ncbi:hypothetical protein ELK52_29420, partial [Klebsiella pneumoniae]|nr:hypothetical protein [Klebsiella pneumoniae]
MAETNIEKSGKSQITTKAKQTEPETVAEAKSREDRPVYWKLTDDEVLLRSPQPEDEYKTSDSWRVFRI